MGLGLSKLQKEILKIAYHNRQSGHVRDSQPDVSLREVLVEIYSFPTSMNLKDVKLGGLVFKRDDVGIKRYQAAYTSTTKSFNRLVARGLVSRHYHGIKLIPNGIKLAEKLIFRKEDGNDDRMA
jgi:hypothetical protein